MDKNKIRARDTGIGEFTIETDTKHGVLAAAMLACSFHNCGASHYLENEEPDGSTSLTLLWTNQPGAQKLPFPLRTPESIKEFALTWLEETDHYGDADYWGDGDNVKGVWLSNRNEQRSNDFYYFLVIKPHWIYYGK